MTHKLLTTLLGLAILAIPAAVPASQPAQVKLVDLTSAATTAPALIDFVPLLANPRKTGDLSIELPQGYTTLEWINQDPFVL